MATANTVAGESDAAGSAGGEISRFVAVSAIGSMQPGPCHAETVAVRFALQVSRYEWLVLK